MTIKGKGIGKRLTPRKTDEANQAGDAGKATATRAPVASKETPSLDQFDTGSHGTFSSSEGEIRPEARPSAKRNFSKLLAQTENKLAKEHRQLQGEVRGLLSQLHEGGDIATELAPLRTRLAQIRRRLATLRRRGAQLGLGPRDFQTDLRPGLAQLSSDASKVGLLAQLQPHGVEMFDAPENPVVAGSQLARGARSARVTRFLMEQLTGEPGPEAKAELDHPRAAQLDELDSALSN